MRKNKLWFRRKTYGWGWTPITWEGWLVTLVVLVIPLIIRLLTKTLELEKSAQYFYTWASVPMLFMALILICFRYGEKPKWQWGVKRTKLAHVRIFVSDYTKSVLFYDLVLSSLGWEKLVSRQDFTTYTDGTLKIIVSPGKSNINQFAFYAETKEVVDEFYREILQKNNFIKPEEAGGSGDKNYYSLSFLDPDGNKLELIYSPFYCDKEYGLNDLENNFNPYQ